ncbi:MAG: ASPIC/UnbV domain-containing protein [Verrucomicrobiales bacterium]
MVYFPAGPSGDYDNDGRLDLFLVNWFQGNRCRLLHNASPAQNHWLRVAASDKGGNRMGIGAKVTLFQAGKLGDAAAILGHAEISTGYGYASGQPAAAHFGLGKVSKVDLRVEFASGTVVEQQGVNAGQILKIAAP